eukprot:scaffold2388_cov271-Prasinococcus_capsulatus_cf.AAC.3
MVVGPLHLPQGTPRQLCYLSCYFECPTLRVQPRIAIAMARNAPSHPPSKGPQVLLVLLRLDLQLPKTGSSWGSSGSPLWRPNGAAPSFV